MGAMVKMLSQLQFLWHFWEKPSVRAAQAEVGCFVYLLASNRKTDLSRIPLADSQDIPPYPLHPPLVSFYIVSCMNNL